MRAKGREGEREGDRETHAYQTIQGREERMEESRERQEEGKKGWEEEREESAPVP